jgi:GNAT superfamily N-acetyltransferase
MDLRSYTLEELEQYLVPLISKPGSTIPLSPLRLASYLDNPRADKGDTVLFEMIHQNQLVGYRTLLPDFYFDREGVPQRFAWLSGNWVHTGMRRQGISTKLLMEAEKKWDGSLMYTNYAPDSKALYDHTGRFQAIANREGRRYYLRSNAEELLGERIKAPALLQLGDRMINQLREHQLKSYHFPKHDSISAEELKDISADLKEIISRFQEKNLFRRDALIFNWALEKPWLCDQKTATLNYHFSYKTDNFENILYEFRQHESGARGMLWLVHHNRTMSVPYLFSEDSEITAAIATRLIRTMIERGCSHTTVRNPELNSQLKNFNKLFLFQKQMPQIIFAHESLAGSLPSNPAFQDGDGDVMFTG